MSQFIISCESTRAECTMQFGPYLNEQLAEDHASRLEAAGYQNIWITAINPPHLLLSPDAVVAFGD